MPGIHILVVVIISLIIVHVVKVAVRSTNHHFKCPDCGFLFGVSFKQFFFTAHSFSGQCYVTCPHCGKKHLLKPIPGRLIYS